MVVCWRVEADGRAESFVHQLHACQSRPDETERRRRALHPHALRGKRRTQRNCADPIGTVPVNCAGHFQH